jgi:hypothetical protein
MKRATQLSETGFWAIDDAKFRIISCVGGRRRSVISSICFTSSLSCCGASLCCVVACSSRERVLARYLRVKVERTTPCFSAIFVHGIRSQGIKDDTSGRASFNGILVWSYSIVRIIVFWWLRALRESAHRAHGHGTVSVHSARTVRQCATPPPRAPIQK